MAYFRLEKAFPAPPLKLEDEEEEEVEPPRSLARPRSPAVRKREVRLPVVPRGAASQGCFCCCTAPSCGAMVKWCWCERSVQRLLVGTWLRFWPLDFGL